MSDLKVEMILQKMKAHQHLIQMMLSIQVKRITSPLTEVPHSKMDFHKWESKFASGVYRP